MSRKYKKMSVEEREDLGRSQMIISSHKLFNAASKVADKLKLGSTKLVSEYPIAIVIISDGVTSIDFLYGPSEFHVELVLSHKHFHNLRLGLAELCQHTPIKEWAISNRLLGNDGEGIESEVIWYGKLLLEACPEVFTSSELFFKKWAK